MIIDNIELDINLRDTSMQEYVEELLTELQKLHDNMSIHAMSDYQLYLKGRKDMLFEIINYINKTK